MFIILATLAILVILASKPVCRSIQPSETYGILSLFTGFCYGCEGRGFGEERGVGGVGGAASVNRDTK